MSPSVVDNIKQAELGSLKMEFLMERPPATREDARVIRDDCEDDIGGDEQRVTSMDVRYNMLTYAHVMLPVWLLTVTYKEKPYQVFINGVTGEVQGARPYSKVKVLTAIAIVLAVIIAIVVAVSAARSGGDSTGTLDTHLEVAAAWSGFS